MQQPKQGQSKFDGMMADKAQQANAPNQIQQTQQASQVSQTAKAAPVNQTQSVGATQRAQSTSSARKLDANRHVEQAGRSDRAQASRGVDNASAQVSQTPAADAPRSSTASGLMGLVENIEKGQGLMDKLINGGLSGKNFNSSELLALQAGMYKYTQELELTGKVVEKATTGLKDTLKTQV